MDMNVSQIPWYSLYGETPDAESQDDIHVEIIEDRSRDGGWIIKPHRHTHLFQIICIFKGKTVVHLEANQHIIEGINIITMPVGTVHGFEFGPGSEGVVISIRESALSGGEYEKSLHFLRPMIETSIITSLDGDDENLPDLTLYIQQIRREFKGASGARSQSLRLLFSLLLVTLRRHLDSQHLEATATQSDTRILARFKQLIDQHYQDHWTVAEYAEKLNTSKSTLNRMCRNGMQSSAKSLIQDRLTNEAKRLLIYTRQPADQVAYTLGFKDPAYFSRFFKKATGLAPGQYRTSHDKESFQSPLN
ncbi:MAG: helix-turn-helix domain-containing protein [Oceanospirillaceae bacterium]|nr:helix-turn-helix domain-containing protein [Oceanospirillaceae bacterium]